MVTKMVFLLSVLGAASSKLLHRRKCDPEQQHETPTLCSNYENILHLDDVQTKLEEKQMTLQQRIDAMEGKARLQLESANSNISALQTSVTNLSNALEELERTRSQTETEFRDAKTQLEKHRVDIVSLKREVGELVKHGENVGGNFSELEDRLDTTERQLREKKAKLEKLETETVAAFNDTKKVLNLHKDELSHLNSTALELQLKVKARLDATETQLEAKLRNIQNNSEAFSARLNEQKAEVDGFKDETGGIFRIVDEQLKTQKTTADRQNADIVTLKNESAGMKYRMRSTEEKCEQSEIKLEVDRLKAEVSAKVAFAATIMESPDAFTGPRTGSSSILIFNRVFTNIGNAYDSKTGIFTAPLKGVYHFAFMTFGYNGHTSGAILVKNGHYQVSTWESTGPDASDTTSNTVILDLNARDTVNVLLWEGGKIHTSVLTGFLVFPTP